MAEESDLEKTEPASPRRLEKAREEGKVARSRELTTFVMLATAVAGLWLTAESLGSSTSAAVAPRPAASSAPPAFDPSHMLAQAGLMAMQALIALAPLLRR